MPTSIYELLEPDGHEKFAEDIFTKIKSYVDGKVQTDVPVNAKFTDYKSRISGTDINGATDTADYSVFTFNEDDFIINASAVPGEIRGEVSLKNPPSNAIVDITRSGLTFTATRANGTTFNFTQQDNNTTTGTTYAANSIPNNTTFSTNGSVYNVYQALKTLTTNMSTENTTDTWIPVWVSGGFQHCFREIWSAKTHSNYNNNQDRLVTKSCLSYWNGAYNSSNSSNLTYCNRGAFGTIVTKATGDYLPSTGGTITGNISWNGSSGFSNGLYWKESGYGDQFKIYPQFSGSADSNYLCLATATGDAETTPALTVRYKFYPSGHLEFTKWTVGSGNWCGWASSRGRITGASDNNLYLAAGSTLIRNYANSAYASIAASAFNNQSSKLIKKNIEDLSDSEAMKLLDVDTVEFEYIDGYGDSGRQKGVIAEDVLSIIPSVVSVPDGYDEEETKKKIENDEFTTSVLKVDYSKFIPYLIKMVQLQQREINILKERS